MSKIKKLLYIIKRMNLYNRIRDLERENTEMLRRHKLMLHMNKMNHVYGYKNTDIRIHFIHLFGTFNVGDEYCGPEFYFDDRFKDYDCFVHDLRDVNYSDITENDIVIFGGGGLLDFDEKWNQAIIECVNKSRFSVVWGAGVNEERGKESASSRLDYSKFTLIGARDYNSDLPYLPCASCMMIPLKKRYEIKRKVGVVEHKKFDINIFPEYEKINNDTDDICFVLRFIGESEVIITNTYHIWYWATLMNKKVILYEKISTKFDHLRYEPVMYSGNLEQDIARCKTHPEALEEAVSLNREFADKVMELLLNE